MTLPMPITFGREREQLQLHPEPEPDIGTEKEKAKKELKTEADKKQKAAEQVKKEVKCRIFAVIVLFLFLVPLIVLCVLLLTRSMLSCNRSRIWGLIFVVVHMVIIVWSIISLIYFKEIAPIEKKTLTQRWVVAITNCFSVWYMIFIFIATIYAWIELESDRIYNDEMLFKQCDVTTFWFLYTINCFMTAVFAFLLICVPMLLYVYDEDEDKNNIGFTSN